MTSLLCPFIQCEGSGIAFFPFMCVSKRLISSTLRVAVGGWWASLRIKWVWVYAILFFFEILLGEKKRYDLLVPLDGPAQMGMCCVLPDAGTEEASTSCLPCPSCRHAEERRAGGRWM